MRRFAVVVQLYRGAMAGGCMRSGAFREYSRNRMGLEMEPAGAYQFSGRSFWMVIRLFWRVM